MSCPTSHTATLSILIGCLAASALSGCLDERWDPVVGQQDQAIIGGRPETGHRAVVALMNAQGFFCSGTLVRPTVVVTAAHCLEGGGSTGLSVYFGDNANQPASGRMIPVASAVLHPHYDGDSISNDIAVVTLSQASDVTPIDIQSGAMSGDWVGRQALFVGYGSTNPWADEGGAKFAVNIPITEVDATTFAYSAPGANTCFGDSGGPAFYSDGNGQLRLIGVTSWGDENCAEFGVDTRVDAYGDFLAPYLDGQSAPPVSTPNVPDSGDFCAEEGWYGDGWCDEDCPSPDPDCGQGDGGSSDDDIFELPPDWPGGAGCSAAGGGSTSTGVLIALALLPLVVVRRSRWASERGTLCRRGGAAR